MANNPVVGRPSWSIEKPGVMRPNRTVDPEGGAWDAYIWVDNADALITEFK